MYLQLANQHHFQELSHYTGKQRSIRSQHRDQSALERAKEVETNGSD